jgi:CubicO group peptidase (beta-lactamase class C family)
MRRHRGRLLSIVCAVLSMCCTSCVFADMLYHNTPDLTAPSYFANEVVPASSRPRPLARRAAEIVFPMRRSRAHAYPSFEDLVSRNGTRALLVLHHDAVVYERYFGDVTAETRLPAFSLSKTFAAVLTGSAERDGLLTTNQHLVDFVPELAGRRGYSAITLEHLLRMTSGIDFSEESVAGAMFYYTKDLRRRTRAYDVKWTAGEHYEYGSINVQLLWEVLHARLGQRTVASYFWERVWGPLGAERAAAWSLDSPEHGVEKLAAGLSATARDYARLGMLFQHQGRVGGQEVVSRRWVEDSLAQDEVSGIVHTTDGALHRGRYQWFLTLDGCCYFAKGYNGQYVFVDRARDVVIVRFGEGYGDVRWTDLFEQMARAVADTDRRLDAPRRVDGRIAAVEGESAPAR